MDRRRALKVIGAATAAAVAGGAASVVATDSLVYRGDTVSVFNRDGWELVVSKTPLGWSLCAPCATAYCGIVTDLFYGEDARENAENAARTRKVGMVGGWPTLVRG